MTLCDFTQLQILLLLGFSQPVLSFPWNLCCMLSLFFQPIWFYFKLLQISLTITQEIKTSVISFKLIEGFPNIKTLRQFPCYDIFFAKKRHVIFILGFLQLKPDSNCGKIEGQKSKKRKPENCGKYVHMYIASTRRA